MKIGMEGMCSAALALLLLLFAGFGAAPDQREDRLSGNGIERVQMAQSEALDGAGALGDTGGAAPAASEALRDDALAVPSATALACDDLACMQSCWNRGRCEGNCIGSTCRCLGFQPVCP